METLPHSVKGQEKEMAAMDSNRAIWEEIERSESYLVASIHEDAATIASSVLKRICHDNVASLGIEDFELYDMKVSAGMVLVQSLNQLGRASDILKELKVLFTSAAIVPVQVLLTGACFQISEGSSIGAKEFLEEFLSEWHFVEEKYCVLLGNANIQPEERKFLEIDEYMEVVEIYAVSLLGTALKDLDRAIAWIEKAALPEDRRQGLLRKLHSLYSVKISNSSQGSSDLAANNHKTRSSSSKEVDVSEVSSKALKANALLNGKNNTKQAILKLSKRTEPFWWFRTINLKFGNARLVISNGKILLGCLIFLICYVLGRKRDTLKGMIRRQVLSIKKAMLDLWQLSFSYQVNPLAAVQPLTTATPGGR